MEDQSMLIILFPERKESSKETEGDSSREMAEEISIIATRSQGLEFLERF